MTNVQPPTGGLIGFSNYNLYSNCEDLTGVSVTIDVTEELVAVPSAPSSAGQQSNGIAFQLNCLPPKSSPATSWQQYIMVVSRDGQDLRWGINNWDNGTQDQLINQGAQLAVIPSTHGAGYASIPAGYRCVIALTNDAEKNVNGAKFSMFDQSGRPLFAPVTIGMTSLVDEEGHQVTEADLGPIADIDFLIVGYANGADTTLARGAGTITYRASEPLTVLNTFPPCTAGVNTAESSNVRYGELDSAANAEILQPFSVNLSAVGKPATLYAPAANNQQHVFSAGTDSGIYNVFYDPGDNKIHGPEQWASSAAGNPATLYTPNGQQHVFYRGTDGALHHTLYDPASNSIRSDNPWVGEGVASDPATLFASAANGQQHVFYRSADNRIYNVFYDPGDNKIHGPEQWW
jgi:hypothetical protein